MHSAAIGALGLDAVYLALPVPPDALPAAIDGMRALGIRGLNVTIPHKPHVMALMDRVDPAAELAGGVNTVVNEEGTLVGHSTDGPGLLRSLAEEGIRVEGARVVLLGSGGSARAIGAALVGLARRAHIAARNTAAARDLASALTDRGLPTQSSPLDSGSLAGALGDADVLINTTPVGMWPRADERPPVPASSLREGLTVVDIIPNPRETMLMRDARRAGCSTIGGLGMLAHQGAISLELWTSRPAPVDAMRRAAEEALGAGGSA
jgi:shikimate dehydrogenase